jgi:hypothetical protein
MKTNKLTPQVLKVINDLCAVLPKDYIKNPDGSIKFRAMAKRVSGKDLNDPEKYDANKIYIQRYSEPIEINHAVKLRGIYSAQGEQGINDYIHKYTIKTGDGEPNKTENA